MGTVTPTAMAVVWFVFAGVCVEAASAVCVVPEEVAEGDGGVSVA